MTIKPIKPSELPAVQLKQIPDTVIDCWNNIIAKNWNPTNKRSFVLQKDIVSFILEHHPDVERRTVFNEHWLDIEDIYRAQGWLVTYDKPHYTENYEASFEFRENPVPNLTDRQR